MKEEQIMMRVQKSFSTLWDGFATQAEAKAARDTEWKRLRASGWSAKRWVLKNQLKQYAGFGQPDGRSCDVYKLDAWK
jgi:hypothetical protein